MPVDQAYKLVQQFANMLRTRTGEQLDDWLSSVRASQIHELQGFVLSVVRDKAAVVAGLTLPQNNGLVEGKVNKLKRAQTHDVWPGRISLVASTCPACFVEYLKGPVLSQ
jgi:transposase